MVEINHLLAAFATSQCCFYELDIEANSYTWLGNSASILGQKATKSLNSPEDLLSIIVPADREKYKSSLEILKAGRGEYKRTFKVTTKDRETLTILDQGTCAQSKNGGKLLLGILSVVVANVSRQRTGIKENYIFSPFESEKFRLSLTRAYRQSVEHDKTSVLLKISIDNLPMLISWYSLDYANRIMEALKLSLQHLLRPEDCVNRIGLDQFGVVLYGYSPSEAELIIDRILRKIQLFNNPSFDEPAHLRCSIGSALFPCDTTGVEDALNKSYLALACVRNKSDAFYCDYKDARKEHLDSREDISKINIIQLAIEEKRLELAFQPIIDTRTGQLFAHESLLRIREKDGAIHSAGSMIPIAERLGVIDMIDFFVMERVVEELRNYPGTCLTFNVSNLTTDNPRWLKIFSRSLSDPGIASRAIVEITETAAQRDMRQTAYFVAALQSLGCRVALDDFGAGYTSLRQLKTLSVDMVKIDGTFVQGVENRSENYIFIKTLLDFNRSYGLDTVAECVETGEAAKELMRMGVDYLQGYYLGKPTLAPEWRKPVAAKTAGAAGS